MTEERAPGAPDGSTRVVPLEGPDAASDDRTVPLAVRPVREQAPVANPPAGSVRSPEPDVMPEPRSAGGPRGVDGADRSARAATPARPPVRSEALGRAPARRRARLALRRVDPWSVFVLALLVALFLALMVLVAVAVLYSLLSNMGVIASVDNFARELELVDPGQSLLSSGRVLGLAAVIAAVDVVLLTVLATLGAFLYNICASLTGGIEVVLGERD